MASSDPGEGQYHFDGTPGEYERTFHPLSPSDLES